MTDYMAQMLNELMGSQRDANPGEKRELRYDDPNVCTDFLVGFCTHEIFRNTKNDLGFCKYSIHDENLKNSYQDSDRKGRMGFENRFLERIRRIHEDVRRKIQKHEDRLAVTQGESKNAEETFGSKIQEIEQRREHLTQRMETLMEEAALEGEKGNVGAAQAAMEKADRAKIEIEELTLESDKLNNEKDHAVNLEENVTAGNRQMQVCQICGCFMLQNDAPQRVDDHLTGKLHIAYQLIADTIKTKEAELEEITQKRMEERFARRQERQDGKHHNRSRSRSNDRKERNDRREGRTDKPEKSEHRREHRDHRDNRDNRGHRHRSERGDRGDRDRSDRAERSERTDRGDRSDRERHRSDRDRDRRTGTPLNINSFHQKGINYYS